MSDDLQIPEVPEPKPEDAEDVSWALSTAEAMWARGDHSEGIKWVRRAAEAASEAENDERALELAKAAADLTGLISRSVSRASIDLEEVVPAAPPPVPSRPSTPPKALSKPPPAVAAKAIGMAPAKQVAPASRPPAPLPSQTSSQVPPAVAAQAQRVGAPGAPRPAAAPAAAATPASSQTLQPSSARGKVPPSSPSKPPPSVRGGAKRTSRKSRENFDAAGETARQPALDSSTSVLSDAAAAAPPSSDTLLGNNDPTVVGNLADLLKAHQDSEKAREASGDGERQTVVGAPADLNATILAARRGADKSARTAVTSGGSTNGHHAATGLAGPAASFLERTAPAGLPAVRPSAAPTARASTDQHDPRIVTTQAVRVVVWRDANGIHVAPAGTVVSAITVDAVLVALEPNADLTAWLGVSGRERT